MSPRRHRLQLPERPAAGILGPRSSIWESLTDPNAEMHLHFEIRVGGEYLGRGLPAPEVRGLYKTAFVSWEVTIPMEGYRPRTH